MKKVHNILVSQPQPSTEHNPYAEMEKLFGVHFEFRQMIRIEGLTAKEFRKQHIHPLDYTAVIMNSRMAIDQYFRICSEMRLAIPDTMHYYCISESVANYLQKYIQYRKRKVFYAEHNNLEELTGAMNRRPDERYIMVLSDVHNDDAIRMFASHRVEVKPAVMYRTVPVEWPKDKPFDHDMVVLFTPSGVTSLRRNFPSLRQGDKVIAVFGQSTAAALREAGFVPDIEAPAPGVPGITMAIRQYLERQEADEQAERQEPQNEPATA
jgi:uroporphyrinogen-III synthase